MRRLQLGDDIDDFCVKCKRVTNHLIVAFLHEAPAKVRCRSCYHEHPYLRAQAPEAKRPAAKEEEPPPPPPPADKKRASRRSARKAT